MIKVLIAVSWVLCLIVTCVLWYIHDLDSARFARGYKLVTGMMAALSIMLGVIVALTIVL